MIQLSAVRFNVESGEIDHNFFDRCLLIPSRRYWSESTRSWWMQQNREVLQGIFDRMEDPGTVMRDFCAWADMGNAKVFMSKPLSFDFPFVSSYCEQFDCTMPYPHYLGVDMRSYIKGLTRGRPGFHEKAIEFDGPAHNALFDVLHQIKIVFAAIKHAKDSGP